MDMKLMIPTDNSRIRSPLLQIVNSVMLTLIAIFLGYLTNSIKDIGNQQESLNIAIAVMNQRFESHNELATTYKDGFEVRIAGLEDGNTIATADRITKTEALEAIDELRKWTERYFERKEQ